MATVSRMPRQWRRALVRRAAKTRCSTTLGRAQVVALSAAGRGVREVVDALGVSRAHVYRTIEAFEAKGWLGLLDARRENGARKIDDAYRATVKELLEQSPEAFGYTRPTWTRELLVLVAEEQTGVRISLTAMGRTLKKLGARRGRPKPVVACTLSARQRRRRLQRIREMLANLRKDEVAVYEDEIDIHLNPKIGADWMNAGQQKHVMTPGKNQKAYLAGCLNARDGEVVWVGAAKKDASLFVAMLEKLDRRYKKARRIHVVLDNYGIHKGQLAQAALHDLRRIRLHFLPPYCPDENRIERLWLDLHANVTRNHKHRTLEALCRAVAAWLRYASPWSRTANAARPPMRRAA